MGEETGQGTGPPLKRKKKDGEPRRKQSRERKGSWGHRTQPRQESGEDGVVKTAEGERPRGEERP